MSLIIENGTIVANADSFATVAELQAYAASYGRTIPSAEAAVEALLRRAALQMNGMAWKGCMVAVDQALAWPRQGVVWANFPIPDDAIPKQIKAGQMALATEIYADDQNPPELKKGAVKREKVEGAVEREYTELNASLTAASAMKQSQAQFMGFLAASKQSGKLVRG